MHLSLFHYVYFFSNVFIIFKFIYEEVMKEMGIFMSVGSIIYGVKK